MLLFLWEWEHLYIDRQDYSLVQLLVNFRWKKMDFEGRDLRERIPVWKRGASGPLFSLPWLFFDWFWICGELYSDFTVVDRLWFQAICFSSMTRIHLLPGLKESFSGEYYSGVFAWLEYWNNWWTNSAVTVVLLSYSTFVLEHWLGCKNHGLLRPHLPPRVQEGFAGHPWRLDLTGPQLESTVGGRIMVDSSMVGLNRNWCLAPGAKLLKV